MVYTAVKSLHILALLIWSGGLFSVHLLLGVETAPAESSSAAEKGGCARAARRTAWVTALPGAAVALLTGVLMISLRLEYFQVALWLHIKLLCVLLLLGWTVWIAIRATLAVDDPASRPSRVTLRAGELIALVLAASAVWLALAKFPILRLGG